MRLLPTLAVAAVLGLGACSGVPVPEITTATAPTAAIAPVPAPARAAGQPGARALDTLGLLPIKGRAPKTGYTRAQFGNGWADLDADGCDTRSEVLERDTVDNPTRTGPHMCVTGTTLLDVYSGQQITEPVGRGTTVDMDHVVALSDSWQKGAQELSPLQRVLLANDPANLIPTSAHLNRQKADADAASWLPPNRAYRCTYIAHQVAVKFRYGLWVTQAEHDAMANILSTCPNEPTPTEAS